MRALGSAIITLLSSATFALATVYTGVMDNRTGFPLIAGFTAQSPAWATGGSTGGGLRLEWQVDNESTPGSWTYTYRLIRGTARNKGFAFFDIETADDFTATDILRRQVVAAHDRTGATTSFGLSSITISDPVSFSAVHDFSNAAVSEANIGTVLSSLDLSHYSGDPGRVAAGKPGGLASPTPSVGPVAHPFYGVRVKFPGTFLDLGYEVSDWEFNIVTSRAPMWGSFFGWGDQTVQSPFWYANFYNNNIDNPVRLDLPPDNSTTGASPYSGWILVPGPLPKVTETLPGSGAGEVPFYEPINAVFNKNMDPATITTGTFTLSGTTGSVSYDQSTRTATFLPDAPLQPGTTYTASLTTAVRDSVGNALAQPKVWTFTTTSVDTVPPAVTRTSPVAGAANIATSSTLAATFSETIDATTLTPTAFTVVGLSFAAVGPVPVNGTISYNPLDRTGRFTPSAALAGGSTYTAAISTAVRDKSGNALPSAKSWTFTTLPDGTFAPGSNGTTVADALRALRFSVNLLQPTAEDLLHGDVAPLGPDGKPVPDGKIDIQDALVVLRKALGILTW